MLFNPLNVQSSLLLKSFRLLKKMQPKDCARFLGIPFRHYLRLEMGLWPLPEFSLDNLKNLNPFSLDWSEEFSILRIDLSNSACIDAVLPQKEISFVLQDTSATQFPFMIIRDLNRVLLIRRSAVISMTEIRHAGITALTADEHDLMSALPEISISSSHFLDEDPTIYMSPFNSFSAEREGLKIPLLEALNYFVQGNSIIINHPEKGRMLISPEVDALCFRLDCLYPELLDSSVNSVFFDNRSHFSDFDRKNIINLYKN